MTRVLVSVGDVIVRDPTTGVALMYGKANIDSAFTMSANATEVRGGINNQLLFTYIHDKKVDVKITDATFNMDILSLNAGTNVLNSSVTALKTECITFSATGSATLADTPVGTKGVNVFLGDPATIQNVTPVGSNITVSGGANLSGYAVYEYTVKADQLTVEAVTPPSIVDLTLTTQERDSVTKGVVNLVQIHIPSFQILGNYTLSMTADGVSNQPLEGTALVTKSTNCVTNDYYATITRIPYTGATPSVNNLYLSKDTSFSISKGLPKTIQLQALGLRGGLNGNIDVTTSASYHVTSGSTTLAAYYNVGANTGLVTAGSSVGAGWIAIITACYVDSVSGILTDTATITATA